MSDSITATGQGPVFRALAALLVVFAAGSEASTEQGAETPAVASNEALAGAIGPDWSVVETYLEAKRAWQSDANARVSAALAKAAEATPEGGAPDYRNILAGLERGTPPIARDATAAALAILDAGPDHQNARDAAEFLVEHATANPQAMAKGARWLAANASDFHNWPTLLRKLATPPIGGSGRHDDFLAEMASDADDPVIRATARYFAATVLAERVNDLSTDAADREANRRKALAMAMGLSVKVEDEKFVNTRWAGRDRGITTMAEAEASLVHSIRHTLVGSAVVDETAERLDGTEDSLSAYAGKVVLMDFWATWCGPCIAAIPRKRDLVDTHTGERFELLGISVDYELHTLTDFMDDEPMPWTHWYVGAGSELGRSWNITGYPTYVVVDGNGVILFRGHDLEPAIEVIEQALADGPTDKNSSLTR